MTSTREERSTRTIDEFIETNLHRLQAPDGHVVGLYRWVDKIYQAKVVNYGKRLMFEFLVPEPAAFHLYAQTEMAATPTPAWSSRSTRARRTRRPRTAAATSRSVTSVRPTTHSGRRPTARSWSRRRRSGDDVKGVQPGRHGPDTQFADSKTDLAMQAGYEATSFFATSACTVSTTTAATTGSPSRSGGGRGSRPPGRLLRLS